MIAFQPGILADVPPFSRYLTFSLIPGAFPAPVLQRFAQIVDGDALVIGVGVSLVSAMGETIPDLKTFPVFAQAGHDVPSTPAMLWCWLRGTDMGDLVHLTHRVCDELAEAFECDSMLDAFKHGTGRDLTGYEDGTENPEGQDAIDVAFVSGAVPGLDGSSFVAVQTWLHDLPYFGAMTGMEQDNIIGRRKSDNEELDDAPESAHVKRTAQEDFTPEAFLLRRSMPWANASGEGLQFVAFNQGFDAFETLLKHMLGLDDGICDALFKFTKPIAGAYFWCPPMQAGGGGLDLRALGIKPEA